MHECPCLINVVVQEAEELFRNKLRTKSLRWSMNKYTMIFQREKEGNKRMD